MWTNKYNGSRNADCQASAVAVDQSGNVFVTGSSYGGSSSHFDYVTIKYSEDGTASWTNRYDRGSTDYATAVAVNGNWGVVVTGQSSGPTGYDYLTISYSSEGIPLWTNQYNGPGNSSDVPVAIALGKNGNVFVTGYSLATSSSTSEDFATIAYSETGVPLWTNRYNGAANGTDRANAVAVDTAGKVFVTGYSLGSGSFYDFLTIAYSETGVPLWTNRFTSPGSLSDLANALAVDSSGNVFVTGFSMGGSGAYNYTTIAYSGEGMPMWTNHYNGSGNGSDQASSLAVDGNGNVFVTGRSGNAGSYDYATIKYSGAGSPLWTNRYNGPANGDDQAVAVVVDGINRVYITGYSRGTQTTNDYATISYSSAGVPLWTNRYNGSTNSDDRPQTKSSLALGPDGSAHVTGASARNLSTGTYDFATVKYSSPAIRLTISKVTNQVHVRWTNACFSLQSAPALTGTYTNIPGATSPYTNPINSEQRFFRLISN